MLIHVLLGGLIGEYSHSVLLIVLLSLVSHFILDMIPHWDGGDFDRKLFHKTGMVFSGKISVFINIFDLLLGVFLLSFLYKEFHSKLMILGAFAAIAPDLAKIGYFTKLKKNKKYMNYLVFHDKIQNNTGWKIGLAVQIIATIFLVILLF